MRGNAKSERLKGAVNEAGARQDFDWPLADDAEQLLRMRLENFLDRNGFARHLSQSMLDLTGTDFFEWIDHFILPAEDAEKLQAAGFAEDKVLTGHNSEPVYEHPRATLPRVLLRPGRAESAAVIAIRPEFVADFVARQNLASAVEGEPFSRYRRVVVAEERGAQLEAIERRGYRGFIPAPLGRDELRAIIKARELWQTRQRRFENEAEGFERAGKVLNQVLTLIPRDVACRLFFENERAYWESRNRAARIQKHKQDQLGLGWGNHDHHTFRCSREYFLDLIEFLSRLGLIKRERYYAGAEAGWGAQILENQVTSIVVFADVDLLPEEREIDFSTTRLPAAASLGTVGLWVGLHGESLLEAGMHHLEARFEFDRLRAQLQDEGVNLMKPFSDFSFLRQAFTQGERWPVRRARAARLLSGGLISREHFDRFMHEGALGSHLENLQRHGGYKGFNQKSVSVVIAATDPRKAHFATAGARA